MTSVRSRILFRSYWERLHSRSRPRARPHTPISATDRVYVADQTSNTVSVIDPSANKLLGLIRLGDPIPAALSPLYRRELLVHGLGYSPDSKTLAVVSIASDSVTLIDTQTNRVKGKVRVGRSLHEAFFTRDGLQLWVAVRGENYISVVDPRERKEIRRTEMANGLDMTIFGPLFLAVKNLIVCVRYNPD
jgi:YVTN family beta-propeller protein